MQLRARLVASLIVLFAALPAFAEEPQPRTISTSGSATVYVAPDEAIVTLGIESFGASIDSAKSANAESSGKLLKAIKELDIESKHVQTDTVQLEIRYKESSHPTLGIEGYYARRTYLVTLKDVKLLEKLIDTALKNGANQLHGFQYQTSELRKHRDQARKMAVKAAKEKAEALATELGCKVGFPRSISESGGYYGGYYGRYGNAMQMQNSAQAMPGETEGGETMPLGQIAVQASVAVTFDLTP